MSQLNNNCESGLTCFEALPLALKENKRECVCVPFACACVRVWQSFDAGSPWSEWLWQHHLPHRMDPRCTVSLEKVKMEGGREAKRYCRIFLWGKLRLCDFNTGCIKSFFSLANYQRIDILSLSLLFFFLGPSTQCEGRVAVLALSLTEEWLLLTAGRIIEKKANKF